MTMSKKNKLSSEDLEVWEFVASSVDEAYEHDDKAPVFEKIIKKNPQKKENYFSQPSSFNKQDLFSKTAMRQNLSHGQVKDIDRNTAEKFVKGKMQIDGRLDLHGYTENQAYDKLVSFILEAYQCQKRCLLIITGKGKSPKYWYEEKTGILKDLVPKWLNHHPVRPLILSFSYAKQNHGGQGAIYVLLKRNRK